MLTSSEGGWGRSMLTVADRGEGGGGVKFAKILPKSCSLMFPLYVIITGLFYIFK